MSRSSENTESPLACSLAAIDEDKREPHLANARTLFASATETCETEDGFEFRFAAAPETIKSIGMFVALEMQCCPFLAFALDVAAENGIVRLKLSGCEGVKEFIRMEISELIGGAMFDSLRESREKVAAND